MKTKPPVTKQKQKQKKKQPVTPTALLTQAESALETGNPTLALPLATKALALLPTSLPALTLLAHINLELGFPSTARAHFLSAAALDPDGSIPEAEGGGAEKFLWLAQLSEEGGRDSVRWFEKGLEALRREEGLLADKDGEEIGGKVEEVRRRIAGAFCGIVEVYMTDLSWDPSAEPTCERLITSALLTAPSSPEPLQTLASIRISQSRIPPAQKALLDSLSLWQNLPPQDPKIPDFPTRISLARLLMEVELEEDALGVVERLVQEDDQSVEAWYLGGWCLWLLGSKQQTLTAHNDDVRARVDTPIGNGNDDKETKELRTASLISSREWLRQSLNLYDILEYEDERLRDHALELVRGLDAELEGYDDAGEDGEEMEGEEGWESEDENIEDDDGLNGDGDMTGDGNRDEHEDEDMNGT